MKTHLNPPVVERITVLLKDIPISNWGFIRGRKRTKAYSKITGVHFILNGKVVQLTRERFPSDNMMCQYIRESLIKSRN